MYIVYTLFRDGIKNLKPQKLKHQLIENKKKKNFSPTRILGIADLIYHKTETVKFKPGSCNASAEVTNNL